MGIALMAGSIAACFLNLDRFEHFKAGNVEAKIQKAVDDAHATVTQLREMAAPLLRTGVHLLATSNRMTSYPVVRAKLASELESSAQALGLASDEKVKGEFRELARLFAHDTFGEFARSLNAGPLAALRPQVEELHDYASSDFPTVDSVRRLLGTALQPLGLEQEALLDRYRTAVDSFNSKG
jgi:hypothetical protein